MPSAQVPLARLAALAARQNNRALAAEALSEALKIDPQYAPALLLQVKHTRIQCRPLAR